MSKDGPLYAPPGSARDGMDYYHEARQHKADQLARRRAAYDSKAIERAARKRRVALLLEAFDGIDTDQIEVFGKLLRAPDERRTRLAGSVAAYYAEIADALDAAATLVKDAPARTLVPLPLQNVARLRSLAYDMRDTSRRVTSEP